MEKTRVLLIKYKPFYFLIFYTKYIKFQNKKKRTLVSYNNIIIFAYHTDGLDRGSSFFGTFEFIDSRKLHCFFFFFV